MVRARESESEMVPNQVVQLVRPSLAVEVGRTCVDV